MGQDWNHEDSSIYSVQQFEVRFEQNTHKFKALVEKRFLRFWHEALSSGFFLK